jgi:sterol desaturase/sphingolipid hydroxylase (fatty acid hydroxylase superfamily)
MGAETFVSAIVPIAYVVLVLSEGKMGGRRFPAVRLWRWTGALFFVVLLTISLLTPFFIPLAWLEAHRVLNLSEWGFASVVPALLTTSFLTYWLHRAEHRLDWMWRGMHQLHHSVLRVDVSGAFFTHPTEMVVKITIGLVVSVFLYGLAPVTAATVSALAALLSMFQHWNARTPQWLGFLVQRPESHCLHHERGVHARNYGDLPIWDMIFGTFANPRTFEGEAGFGERASRRIGAMLFMRDVSSTSDADGRLSTSAKVMTTVQE